MLARVLQTLEAVDDVSVFLAMFTTQDNEAQVGPFTGVP